MRAIADNMPALIAHIDRDERYLFVNAMGANIFGINIDDMAGRLLSCVRAGDLVARLGGDEFMVLVANPAPDSAESIARHVRATMREPVELGAHMKLPIGTSIGVAYASSAVDAKALLSMVDRALYRAKAAGRNTWRAAGADETAASA
jgi:diguanylate cyclase (GGDEF)-like protein